MPGDHEAFDAVDDPEQDHAEQRQNHQCREHRRQVEGADRALQHIADARIGADEFADHGADHGERDGDLQPGEDRGHRMRQVDGAKYAEAAALHGAGEIDHIGIDRFKTLHGGHDDGEESEQKRRDHLRNDAEAEPHHEQRRDRDLRHRLREHQQRIDVAFHRLRSRDQHGDGNAEQRRQQEAADGGVGGGPGLPKQLRPIGPQHRHDIAGRGDLVGGNPEHADGQVPGHHDEEQKQKRPHPRSIQRFRHATLALQLRHVPLPDNSLFGIEINPLDKYWQAGFRAVFCRSCERRNP